ncbi:unnamed protein product [Didymodactylos carnosus]|uniref:C2H2-type domain-containing protein n=1 Tax=Didymodactylos carnosus TaxID=1234261 RepID=A0A814I6J3_9BILA|nr:unnamed protein product [Didymodactylos carnosus]CAF1260106.1 unnamed protein product [Didymodactylos carnosus]CAF3791226.1 unnamed protein product [Didymodactylos carnosus]CAF4066772.1 unnamed protein product [Didymodactylos carnosus]
MSGTKIIKPIATYATTPYSFHLHEQPTKSKPLVVAGTTLKEGSLIYLLHRLPANFLLQHFYDDTKQYDKIPIQEWNQHLIGPGLFQEWISAIRSARNPDEQNLELFEDTITLGFRTTRTILPEEPLLAWFSLQQLRTICERIKMTKKFKVEELLKSSKCPQCKVDYLHINVLVAHVLLDECTNNTNIRDSHTVCKLIKKRCYSKTSREIDQTSTSSITSSTPSNLTEEVKTDLVQRPSFTSNDMSYKMSVLDGTHALEFSTMDFEGCQRKAHLCLFCGKVYNRKYGLKIHLRTHTGYKPLKCRVCLRPFSDPSNLNKHIRLHSQTTTSFLNHKQQHPYKCEQCEKVLVRKRDLDRHMTSRHPSHLQGNIYSDTSSEGQTSSSKTEEGDI